MRQTWAGVLAVAASLALGTSVSAASSKPVLQIRWAGVYHTLRDVVYGFPVTAGPARRFLVMGIGMTNTTALPIDASATAFDVDTDVGTSIATFRAALPDDSDLPACPSRLELRPRAGMRCAMVFTVPVGSRTGVLVYKPGIGDRPQQTVRVPFRLPKVVE